MAIMSTLTVQDYRSPRSLFLRQPNGVAMKLWYGQMALNWIWSPVWFALHLLWLAFVVIACILALIVAFTSPRAGPTHQLLAVRPLRGVGRLCQPAEPVDCHPQLAPHRVDLGVN